MAASSRTFSRWLPVACSLKALAALTLVRLACWGLVTHSPALRLPRVRELAARASSLP